MPFEFDQSDLRYVESVTSGKKMKESPAQERNHKCQFCSKTYLSYPALYTHLRNKHAK